ncbi:MAG: hypothetical protein IPF99_27635 [Deltaproteobacteria bacterium]|nr:hypothetical protein [Deltaproteobacteria bacterium]
MVLLLWQFVPTPVLEVPDLACIDTPRAEQIAVLPGLVGPSASSPPGASATAPPPPGTPPLGHPALLVGALQTVLTSPLSPHCATGNTVAWMLGCASLGPRRGLLRTGVALLPPPSTSPPMKRPLPRPRPRPRPPSLPRPGAAPSL